MLCCFECPDSRLRKSIRAAMLVQSVHAIPEQSETPELLMNSCRKNESTASQNSSPAPIVFYREKQLCHVVSGNYNADKLRCLAIFIILLMAVPGCSDSNKATKSTTKADTPAKVEKPNEANLSKVTLTAKAVERLGISYDTVKMQPAGRVRTFGGEVIIPPGNRVIVSAPLAGALSLPEGKGMVTPGQKVTAGEVLFTFTPLLPPEREVPSPAERIQIANARASLASLQITAEGEVKRSRAELDGAKIALERAQQLLRDRAGAARDVDNAMAALQIAEETYKAAVERETLLRKLSLDSKQAELPTIPVTVPVSGTLQAINVTRGQTVAVGEILFEIAELDELWVRVPVYVGQINELLPNAEAKIANLSASPAESHRIGRPVAAPPTANALASTADIYFSVDNRDMHFRPGQRVGVTLPLNGETESLTVPAAAVLIDIYGGSWVYATDTPNTFHRERIVVDHLTNDTAVLASGPKAGTQIIVDGTAEVFGTEFGTGK